MYTPKSTKNNTYFQNHSSNTHSQVSQSAKDIISVLVTSKQFYRISKPLVYITILLPARMGWEIFDSIDIRDRIKVLTSKIDSIARYIQDLGLCQAEPMLEIREDTEKRRVSAELAPILAKIPPGHLRSFRWDIRAKCPEEILTNLHTHQLNLETLIIHYPSFDYISEIFIGNFTRKLKNSGIRQRSPLLAITTTYG